LTEPGTLPAAISLKAVDNFARHLEPITVFIPGKPRIAADPQTQLLHCDRREKTHLA
jgi:hypothetical protein